MSAKGSVQTGTLGQSRKLPRIVIGVLLACVVVALLLPLVWMLVTTLKPEAEIGASPLAILPIRPTLEQYGLATTLIDYTHFLVNGIKVAVVYTVPVVISSLMAGYAFARVRARGARLLFSIVVGTMLVPTIVYIIPLFVVYSRIGLVNSLWPFLLWGLGGNPFYIFLFRQFFDAFPKELEEAALLDGCSRAQVLMKIVIPNTYTAIATITILAFTGVWGDVLVQSIFLNQEASATLAVRLAESIFDASGKKELVGATLAGVTLYVLPPLLVFVFFQRYILRGVVTSGLKG